MMTDRLVSVMVPAYNAAATIVDTLDSVWNQAYRPIELIIVNDGSTDQTEPLVEQWSNARTGSDFEITIESQPNRGLLESRNRGLALSRGRFLQFLDSDDLLHRQKLARCVPLLADDGTDVVVPSTDLFRSTASIVDRLSAEPEVRPWKAAELRRASTTRTFWHSVGPLFQRRIVEAVGGFSSAIHPVAEELEFHARIKLATQNIRYLDEVLSYYRVGSQSSVTGSLQRLYDGRIAGARHVRDLLQSHGVRSFREWSGLITMCFQTYYQTICCSKDTRLHEEAWRCLLECVRAWSPALGASMRIPRPLIDPVLLMTHRLRRVLPTRSRRFAVLRGQLH